MAYRKKGSPVFDKEKSLTKLTGEYKVATGETDRTEFTYYSYLHLDEVSKELGQKQLRRYALNNFKKILRAKIYDNISGELLDEIIVNGQLV